MGTGCRFQFTYCVDKMIFFFLNESIILWPAQEPSQKHMLKLIDKAIFAILRSATGYFFMSLASDDLF